MTRLRHDARGAIMLIGLFMAILLAGAALYLVGLGEAMWQRERMQDAADSAAFSAAVLHARGMNVIALLNMAMAALLAVLVAIKVVETVAAAVVVVTFALCLFPGTGCPFVAPARLVQQRAGAVHEALQGEIHLALRALRLTARGVRVAVPWVAQARVAQLVTSHYAPPANIGLVLPSRLSLPTRDGDFGDLCARSIGYVSDLVALPFRPFGGLVADVVSETTEGLLATAPGHFCGTPGSSSRPPSTTVWVDVRYPQLEGARECAAYGAAPDHDHYDEERHARACDQAQDEVERATPDADTGACQRDCGPNGAYEQAAAQARVDCAPRAGDDPLRGFRFQVRTFTRTYVYERDAWHVLSTPADERTTEHLELQPMDSRLCGTTPDEGAVSPEWNASGHRDTEGRLAPLCQWVEPPSEPGIEGEQRSIEHVQVLNVFSCYERVERGVEIDGSARSLVPASENDADAMAPQLLEEGAALGSDPFQLRAVVIGDLPRTTPQRVLGLLRDTSGAGNGAWRAARSLGHVAVAQAEHYFAVQSEDYDPAELLWEMRWQARLRRFHFAPEHSDDGARDARNRSVGAADVELATESAELDDIGRLGLGDVATSFEAACRAALDVVPTSPHDEGSPCDLIDLSFRDAVLH